MEQDFHAEEIERRYNETVERGTVQGDTFITPSGASVPMLAPQPDDNELEDSGCVYCDGEGIWREEIDNGYFREGHCDACRGTGKAGRLHPKRQQRMEDWLSMIFFTDAPRFEMMDRDICPDCGAGGCGGECHWTPEQWARMEGEPEESYIPESLRELVMEQKRKVHTDDLRRIAEGETLPWLGKRETWLNP
jgi:hypothetical protein